MQIKIEKNVPIPSKVGRNASRWIEILGSMNPGDSFELDKKKLVFLRIKANKLGYKTTARTLTNPNKSRVWLVSKSR